MDKIQTLNKFEFYRNAPASFQEELQQCANPARLEQGAYFFRQGENCPQFAMMASGNIRVFKISDSGKQITLYHLEEGETCLVNMICAFLGTPSPAFAQAETDVEALLVPAERFRQWIRTNDIIRAHVFERMSARIVEVMQLVEEVAFRRMDHRVAEYLLRHFQGSQPIISTTHEGIASELGSVREVVSRVLKEMERSGAILLTRGRIELRDEFVLRQMGSLH